MRRRWSPPPPGSPGLVCTLLLLHVRSQVSEAAGTFELQIRFARNEKGVLADGRCCRGGLDPPCPAGEQCRTFFRACLKEYQLRAIPGGPCILGTATTPVLGGNVFSTAHRKHRDPGDRLVVPFDFAWPRSYSLVLEVWDAANDSDIITPGSGQLMERVTRSGMLNPGEGWQDLWHHSRGTSLDYRVRVRCREHYYGPVCNLLCRPRDDFFGHHTCDMAGNKVCLPGWTGEECKQAICRQGCHEIHGYCEEPGECRCHYGWKGPLCDECILFPGCVHGSCTEPWKCDCDTNWGGLLCDKDLNYCGSHHPCKNGGTCANKEPNEYECFCLEGFHGRNCEHAFLPLPINESNCAPDLCANGGTCLQSSSGSRCLCPPGWIGVSCRDVTTCLSEPCSHGGSCRDHPDGFKCLCPPQWMGKTCQIDVNECQKNPCLHARSCKNLIGNYFCDCLEGWTGPNCDAREDACQRLCHNGGTCKMNNGIPTCFCQAGYTGAECETQLSPCSGTPCLNGGQCWEAENKTFLCSCPPGHSSSNQCKVSADFCSLNPCPQGASCISGEGSYVCSCPEGAICQRLQDPCLDGLCQGVTRATFFYVALPIALVFFLAIPTLTFLALCLRRQSQQGVPVPPPPAANNSVPPDVVRLIHNITHGDVEQGLREDGAAPKTLLRSLGGLPKMDISNEERAKLNQLNAAPVVQGPSF